MLFCLNYLVSNIYTCPGSWFRVPRCPRDIPARAGPGGLDTSPPRPCHTRAGWPGLHRTAGRAGQDQPCLPRQGQGNTGEQLWEQKQEQVESNLSPSSEFSLQVEEDGVRAKLSCVPGETVTIYWLVREGFYKTKMSKFPFDVFKIWWVIVCFWTPSSSPDNYDQERMVSCRCHCGEEQEVTGTIRLDPSFPFTSTVSCHTESVMAGTSRTGLAWTIPVVSIFVYLFI